MSQAAVQTLDISPVGRVEGDLDVRVDLQDGVVVNAWTSAELFRGFEVILRDKDPQAGLVVTPRACGICGASHLTCAAWALDTAWGTEVPRNAILARNLGQLTESLPSQTGSSQVLRKCSRIDHDRVTSVNVGEHMTPPGTL